MDESLQQTESGARAVSQNPVIEILRNELSRRMQKNPLYSLRAFAKTLGISHTLLSLVLNGHRNPSRSMLMRLVERLELSSSDAARLLGDPTRRRRAPRLTETQKLTLDQFALISEWQHFAILSLLEIPGTEFDQNFIAQRLGISQLLAKVSMQRLVELGIVEKGVDGRWRQRPGPIVVENTKSTECTRKFNRQLIHKALESLENDPIEARDFSSMTFAMSPSQVPRALERIRSFRRELVQELEAEGKPEEVYHLTVQIFPTSKWRKL